MEINTIWMIKFEFDIPKKLFLIGFLCLITTTAFSQQTLSESEYRIIADRIKKEIQDSLVLFNDSTQRKEKTLQFSGYIETYYSYDFAQQQSHVHLPFMYSYNRNNEFNLNLGMIKLAYATNRVHANIAFMAGTYTNENLSAEPGVLKNVMEANVGFKLAKNKNLWLDAGIFPSHIGFESAVGKDCWILTRSILAENSPYYEAGVKVSYKSNHEKWFLSGLVLNGWQQIYRPDGNNTPAFGHQLTFTPNSHMMFNSSSFIGSNTPDSVRLMRYFHNFYTQIQLHEKLGLIAGFDFGFQQKSKHSSQYNNWFSPVLILKYSPFKKWNFAARGEFYSDRNGVMIAANTANGFQTWGYSLNVDYAILDNLLWRIEARRMTSKDALFTLENQLYKSKLFLTTSLAISF